MIVQDIKTTLSIPTLSAFTVLERAVLYARVSGDDTRTDGRNLAGQLDMCREFALSKGYRVVAELSEDDKGATGVAIDLPQLNKIRDMSQAGEIDILIVREIDRLSRSLAKQLIVEEELKRAGVRIEYVLANYDDTPEGRLSKHIRATIAEYEREKINQRMTRGKRLAAKAGKVLVANMPPYGYTQTEENNKTTLVIDEEEARVVRLIFHWYSKGKSIGWIAKALNTMAIPSWADSHSEGYRVSKQKTKGRWAKGVISRILENETYIGIWHYGKYDGRKKKGNPHSHWIPIQVPAILSKDLWEAAQTRKEQNKMYAKRNFKHEYLLYKRTGCGCGYRRICETHGRNKGYNKTYRYYKCSGNSQDLVRKCKLPMFRAEQVDKVVWEWVKSFLTNPTILTNGLTQYQARKEEETAPIRERLAVIEDLLTNNQVQLNRLLDLYLGGDFPKEMLTERKRQLEMTIKGLETEKAAILVHLEESQLSQEQLQVLHQFAATVREELDDLEDNYEGRCRIIELLDVQATLTVEDNQKIVYVRCILGEKIFVGLNSDQS